MHHVIPKSEGGTSEDSNKVPACRPCHDGIHIVFTNTELVQTPIEGVAYWVRHLGYAHRRYYEHANRKRQI